MMQTTEWKAKTGLLTMLTLAIALAMALPGWAGPQVFNTSPISGTYLQAGIRGPQPFVIQIFSPADRCLRIENTSQGADMEAVLIAPDGTVWRDDDSGGCFRCPLIKANPTPVSGWYLLQISHFDAAAIFANFTLTSQVLTTGDASCAGPTPTLTPTQGPEKATK